VNERGVKIEAPPPEQLLRLKREIIERWGRLPPEHQATMLPVLLDHAAWGRWSVWTWLAMNPNGGEGS
jgi:hypothetical protein